MSCTSCGTLSGLRTTHSTPRTAWCPPPLSKCGPTLPGKEKRYYRRKSDFVKKHRTGNPTPEDSPVSWDSVRPDQPKYLRIDREVYHHYKKAFIIIIRDKCDFDWQGSAFMELSPDYVERMNLWRDLIGDWPPHFPQAFHWPCTVISVNMPTPYFYRKYAPPFSEGSFLKILW